MTLVSDRVVLVTGAAQGIGRHYAERLAADGALVAAADIRRGGVDEVVDGIVAGGGKALGLRVDITDAQSCQDMAAAVMSEYGRVDALVNNAAMYAGLKRGDPFAIPPDEWDRVMEVNVKGAWNAIAAVAPHMISAGSGRIVVQASTAGLSAASPTLLHYSTSKSALLGMTRALAKHLGPSGITVNTLAPGQMDTQATLDLVPRERLEHMSAMQAIRRIGTPEDLYGAVSFLCSDGSGFITGQTFVVDGGLVML